MNNEMEPRFMFAVESLYDGIMANVEVHDKEGTFMYEISGQANDIANSKLIMKLAEKIIRFDSCVNRSPAGLLMWFFDVYVDREDA